MPGMEALSDRDTLAPQEPHGRDSWFDYPDAIDLDSGETGPEDGLKAEAISRARTAEASYNWIVARTAWEEALGIDSEDTWAWAQYAHLLSVNMHLFDAAEAAYRRGLRSDPTDDWLWAKLGIMLADFCGRVEEGQELLRKAIALDSRECYYHGWLGWSLYRQSDKYSEAAGHLSRAVELWPEYQWAWFHLGFVRMSLGDQPKQAEKALKMALELDANDVVSLFNLASLYDEQFGDAAKGYRTYLKAHKMVPEDTGILKKLGLLALGPLGDMEKAEEWFPPNS